MIETPAQRGSAAASPPSLAVAAHNLASVLGVIVRMSDDVKHAASPLDAQGKLLKLQTSIQKNADRITPLVQVVIDAVAAEKDKT